MSKHTKGPWSGKDENGTFLRDHSWDVSNEDDFDCIACAPIHASGRVIALAVTDYPDGSWKDDSELEANAALIAAAPELLEALESIEMRLDAFNEAQRDMPADSVWVCLEKARAAIAKAKGETA